MKSANVDSSITVSEVIESVINSIRETTTAVYEGYGVFSVFFDSFIFSENPANGMGKWLKVGEVAEPFKKCVLIESGKIKVPNLPRSFEVGETYTITEADPFFYDGYIKEMNLVEMAYPAIWMPRPQTENIAGSFGESLQTDINLTLMFGDLSDGKGWRDNIGLSKGNVERPFREYIEKPVGLLLRKFINKLDHFVYESGHSRVTVLFQNDKISAKSIFIRRFGEQTGLVALGFDENISGFTVEIALSFANIACINFDRPQIPN
jgi:hypothetical protein